MCGRRRASFPGARRLEAVAHWLDDRGYNTPSSATIPVVIERDGERQVSECVWGPGPRIQGWFKQIINVKLNRLTHRPMWEPAMTHGRRGVVVTNGYYEWSSGRGSKQPC